MLTKPKLKIFLELIEIRTKIASILPMTIGILFSMARFDRVHLLNTVVFFLAAVIFDMFTTALNNTMDYKKALNDDYRDRENVIGQYQLSYQETLRLTLSLLIIAIILSIALVLMTNIMLLPIGILCFVIGILYTFGPVPISRTPFGELFSSLTMGFGIIFLSIFVQSPSLLITAVFDGPLIHVEWHWLNTLEIFLLSLPIVLLIANIMLANNIRDLEMDIKNERFTLVYYLGYQKAKYLYMMLSGLAWLVVLINVLLKILPLWSVMMLFVAPLHFFSVKRFKENENLKKAFIESIKSFAMMSGAHILVMTAWILFK